MSKLWGQIRTASDDYYFFYNAKRLIRYAIARKTIDCLQTEKYLYLINFYSDYTLKKQVLFRYDKGDDSITRNDFWYEYDELKTSVYFLSDESHYYLRQDRYFNEQNQLRLIACYKPVEPDSERFEVSGFTNSAYDNKHRLISKKTSTHQGKTLHKKIYDDEEHKLTTEIYYTDDNTDGLESAELVEFIDDDTYQVFNMAMCGEFIKGLVVKKEFTVNNDLSMVTFFSPHNGKTWFKAEYTYK